MGCDSDATDNEFKGSIKCGDSLAYTVIQIEYQ